MGLAFSAWDEGRLRHAAAVTAGTSFFMEVPGLHFPYDLVTGKRIRNGPKVNDGTACM